MNEPTVWVRRNWDCPEPAEYSLSALRKIHWADTTGSVQNRNLNVLPQPFLSGFVSCTGAIRGELQHAGINGGPCPHSIQVVVIAKDNPPAVIRTLREEAGPKPAKTRGRRR